MSNASESSNDWSAACTLIEYALSINALELVPEGRALKSGRISPYFFNSGLFCDGDSLETLIDAYYEVLDNSTPIPSDLVIFGPAYKGISLAVGLAMATGREFAFNRKEEKTHGDGGTIVGAKMKDKPVLIVDDVMTTGTSSGEAVEIVRAAGGTPIGCVIAFDRQEKMPDVFMSATEAFTEQYNIPVYSAATLEDLVRVLQYNADNMDPGSSTKDILQKIYKYNAEYGIQDLVAKM